MKQKLFLSTAIDYVNSFPHMGHALEKVQADVVARYHRILNEDVFFLSGTDEHSLKNVKTAEKERTSVKELVDKNSKKFYELKKAFNLSFDDFIRTTEGRHIEGAQKFWLACQKDIYKREYQGLYCVGCEVFLKEKELIDGLCPEHKIKPELIKEENYFFKLSKYQNQLKKIIENDSVKIIPQTRKNEVLSFINSGLEDICVSRKSERGKGWGIIVPNDASQIFWTWFDALPNYINALGYADNSEEFQEWWQENKNILHIIGKGVLRFHAVYWLAFLLSAKLNLPKVIFAHSYLTLNGQKMSKSLGNIIDPLKLVEKYGTDAVRYFLLREIPSTKDGDFTIKRLEERYNSDLAAGLGNFVSRVLTMVKMSNSKPQSLMSEQIQNSEVNTEIIKAQRNYKKELENFKFNQALEAIWQLIGFSDCYIEKEKPWESPEDKLSVLNDLLLIIREVAKLLEPFLPQTSKKIFEQLKVQKPEPLFPRLN